MIKSVVCEVLGAEEHDAEKSGLTSRQKDVKRQTVLKLWAI